MAENRAVQTAGLIAALMTWCAGSAWCLGDVQAAARYQRYDALMSAVFGAITPGTALLIAAALFLLLAFLPFLPGLIELRRRINGILQHVDAEYVKDPRYFDRSFVRIITRAVGAEPAIGQHRVRLSGRPEVVTATGPLNVEDDGIQDTLLYVSGDVLAGRNAAFTREAYVRGSLRAGPAGMFKAVAATGDLTFGPRSEIMRWAGTDGAVTVGDDSNLGRRISCNGTLELGRRSTFKYLSGNPVMTRLSGESVPAPAAFAGAIDNGTLYLGSQHVSIPPGSVISNDIVVKSGLTINARCTINGTLKVHGDLMLGAETAINGNIFCEGDLRIGEGCRVSGAVFCLHTVLVGAGTVVGASGSYRSLIARRRIELAPGVTVYGQIMTEGEGKTL